MDGVFWLKVMAEEKDERKSCVRQQKGRRGQGRFSAKLVLFIAVAVILALPRHSGPRKKGSRLPCCVIDWSSHTS